MEYACRNGHVNVVPELINAGADAHLNPDGKFFASAMTRRDCKDASKQPLIDVLLNANCVVNPGKFNFWNSIGSSGAHAFAKQCLDRWKPDEYRVKYAISEACLLNDADMIKCLCDYSEDHTPDGINLEKVDSIVKDLIFWKDNFTDTSGIDYVLTRYGHMYASPTVLMFHAAAAGSAKMLTGYLADGMRDVNAVLDVRHCGYFHRYRYGSNCLAQATALSVASDRAVIQLLLDAKADVSSRGWGASVLTGSLINNRPDSVKMLIDAGASLRACLDHVPLLTHTASMDRSKKQEHDMIAIFNLLMDAGVKTRPYNGGRTILHEILLADSLFACANLPALVKNVFLPRDPGLLEARDDKGNTALLSAFVDNVNSDIVFDKARAMLEAGADPTVCDAVGETVLMKAMKIDEDYYRNNIISKVIESIRSRGKRRRR
jgi:ankyrin repeat protein